MHYGVMACFLFVAFFSSMSFAAKGIDLHIKKATLTEALSLIYSEIFNRPYMIDPSVLQDTRHVSFRITKNIDADVFVERYLRNMGIRTIQRDKCSAETEVS